MFNWKGGNQRLIWCKENDLISHNGGDPGCTSYVSFNPKTKCGTLVYLDIEFSGDTGDNTTAKISDLEY